MPFRSLTLMRFGWVPVRGALRRGAATALLFSMGSGLLSLQAWGDTIEVPSGALYLVNPDSGEVLWKHFEVQAPMRVRALSDDRFLVCDFGTGRVSEIDRSGKVLWETPGNNADDARRLPNGGTLIVNNGNSEIQLLDGSGKSIRVYREGLDHPASAILTASDTLIVADTFNKRIVELDPQGAALRQNLEVSNPLSIEPFGDGTYLVADANHHKVFRLDTNWNLEPIAAGLHHPSDARPLPNGNILVADTGNGRVVEIDPTGTVLKSVQFDQKPRSADALSDGTWIVALTFEEKRIEVGQRSIEERIAAGEVEHLSDIGPAHSMRERYRYTIAVAFLVGVLAVWLFFQIRSLSTENSVPAEIAVPALPPDPEPTAPPLGPRFRWSLSKKKISLIGVFFYLAVNAVLLKVYLDPSQVDSIRVDCRGTRMVLSFGEQEIGVLQGSKTPTQGGIALSFWRESANDQACEKVVVRKPDSGEILYEADFRRPETLSEWTAESGEWRVIPGVGVVNDSNRAGVLRYEKEAFGDCSVEFLVRNAAEVSVWVRTQGNSDYAKFTLRPERHMDAWLELNQGGRRIPNPSPPFAKIVPPFTGQVLRIARQLLGSYFFAVVLVVLGGIGFLVLYPVMEGMRQIGTKVPILRTAGGWGKEGMWPRLGEGIAFTLAGCLSVWMFLESKWVAEEILERMPHLQDSVAYLFQAKIFAGGDLWVPSLEAPYRRFFDHEFIVNNGKWFGLQSPGTALLLSLGVLAGKYWLVNPILGGISVFVMFLCGRSCYGTWLGLFGAVLLCLSPWVPLMSGTLMSHPAALLSTLILIWGLVEGRRGNRTWPFLLAGFGLGSLMLIRLGNAFAVGLPALTWALGHVGCRVYQKWKNRESSPCEKTLRRTGFPLIWRYCVTGIICLAAIGFLAFYNWRLTGSPLKSTYKAYSPHLRMGFGPDVGVEWGSGHDRHKAITNLNANLTEFRRYCFSPPSGSASAWDQFLSRYFNLWLFAPLCAVFLTLDRRPIYFLLLAIILGTVAVYFCYFQSGIAYGPRFYYEILGPFLLLSLGGASRCAELLSRGLSSIGLLHSAIPMRVTIGVLTLVLFLPAFSGSGWKSRESLFESYRGFNGISRSTLAAIEKEGLENAIVFVEANQTWVSYGQVFSAMSPLLDDTVLYARDGGVHNVPKTGNEPLDNKRLKEVFPDRKFYRFRSGKLMDLEI